MGSPSGKLDGTDWGKLGKGILIAAGGAAVTYLSQWVSDVDFGVYTPIVTAAAAFAVNFIRKLAVNNADSQ